MKIICKTVAVLLLLFFPGLSFADMGADSKISFGVGGSYIFENFDTSANPSIDESTGFNAKLGYQLQKDFVLEIEYLFISGFDINANGRKIQELDGYAVTLNAKQFLAVGKHRPYFILGSGIADFRLRGTTGSGFSISESDTVWRFGAGLDFYVSDRIRLFWEASYYLTQDEIEDLDFIPVTFGANYSF